MVQEVSGREMAAATSPSQIAREMARVDSLLSSPESKGKRVQLKAYYLRLYTMYREAVSAATAVQAL